MKTKDFNSIIIRRALNGVSIDLDDGGLTKRSVFTSMEELNEFLAETIVEEVNLKEATKNFNYQMANK